MEMNETYVADDWSLFSEERFLQIDKLKRALESDVGYTLADDITKMKVSMYKAMFGEPNGGRKE